MPSKYSKMAILGFLRLFRPVSRGEFDSQKDDLKILLVKQSERMGNVILLYSAVNALKREFPNARIDLLLPGKYSQLMVDARFNRVIDVQKREYIARPWRLFELLRRLRKSRYDLAVDCSDINSHSLTEAVYTLLSGASYTAGWRIGGKRVFDIEAPKYAETIHASEMYLRLLAGIFDRRFKAEPYFPESEVGSSARFPLVGINCGGRDGKRWGLDNFIELGRKLSAQGIKFEYILGPEEEDQRLSFEKNLPENGRLLPLTPIRDLKALFRRYTAFVSSDTGPMHLAWSLRIPTIAIFVDSELEKFKPLAPGSAALDAVGGVDVETVLHHLVNIARGGRVPA